MRRNRGNRRWVWLIALLLPLWVCAANVHIEVDKPEVTRGDTVTFTIRADGSDVSFPTVKQIGKYPILGSAQSSNITIVNGSVKRTFSKSYTFAPMEDVTIPPLTVEADGKRVQTEPLTIHVVDTPAPSAGGAEAQLLISLSKKRAKVGEPLELNVTVRYKPDAGFVQMEMPKLELSDFWIKKVGDAIDGVEGSYRTKTQRYLIFPQKAGVFQVGPLTMKLAKRVRVRQPFGNDPFFNDDFFNGFFAQLKWTRIASNRKTLHVDPLPGGVELYGRFDIHAEADKTVVEANKPVRVNVRIDGEGNIDDIRKYDPHIPDAVVYADDPKIKTRLINGRYGGTFTQTITVVADHDFTFPSLTLRYYDPDQKRVVEKRTAPIDVHVKGGVKKAPPAATSQPKEENVAGTEINEHKKSLAAMETEYRSSTPIWLAFAGGFLLGALTLWLVVRYGTRFKKKKEPEDIVTQILRTKDDRTLLALIIPYAMKDEELKAITRHLEAKIFGNEKYKPDREKIAAIVADLLDDERISGIKS